MEQKTDINSELQSYYDKIILHIGIDSPGKNDNLEQGYSIYFHFVI